MSWQNAPTLNRLTASQQGGSRGAQLWGSQYNGKLYTIFQETPGGGWSDWRAGSNWNGHDGGPSQVYELAAAQQNDGRVQFWALDMKLQLWTTGQTSPGGDWSAWEGPNWNGAAQGMKRIAAAQQGGQRGAQLWGVRDDYTLVTCYQKTAGGSWSGWEEWGATGDNYQLIEVTAAQQNDGRVQLWGLDTKRQLWSSWQTSPGGNWTHWSGPNWNGAPPLDNIAACQQGGNRGAQIWGITENYTLVTDFQETPGGGWSGWSSDSFGGAPPVYEITAAQQNDGRVQLWAVTTDQHLISIYQTSPGGGWSGWVTT
ncbi:MAG TPA: hypothetical protein VER32_11155 [Pyrinomonadaceae bacterium]|nr:hypothetical protein [Pyrinomonadaceae bacterium]